MTRKDQKIAKMKRTRALNKFHEKNARARVLNKFIRHLGKLAAEIPDVPQKDSITRTLDIIRVTVESEKKS